MIGARALRALIANHPSRPFRHTYFRAMQLRFNADPLGRLRPIVAQRFNIAGGARVLYLGDNQVTCLHEVQAFGLPANAVAILPIQFQLNAVLDLRDPGLQNALGIVPADISRNFRALPAGSAPTDMQRLGEAVAASLRVDGLLFESVARPGSACLALVEASVAALASTVQVFDHQHNVVDQLP